MGKAAAEEESGPDDQEHQRAPSMHSTSPLCVAEETHWVEPDQEADDRDSGVPDQLGKDVRQDKSGPVVSSAFSLAGFVQFALDHEHRNDLQDERDDNEEEDEDAECLVLEALLGVVGHEERETDEKRLHHTLARFSTDLNTGTLPLR